MIDNDISVHYKHNYIVNVFDGVFFGLALGFASFTTIIPLFVAQFTESAVLIGLIPAIHAMGWQFPQLLMARGVARMERFKPFVMFMTIHERVPFLGLGIIALISPYIHNSLALLLIFIMLIWQALGGGLTANAWQNFINRIIPGSSLATFLGVQASAMNLFSSLGAFLAGFILDGQEFPGNFAFCFLIASFWLVASYASLNLSREPSRIVQSSSFSTSTIWHNVKIILKRDTSFRWFLFVRVISQFGMMAFAFFTVYAVQVLGMNVINAGIMTAVNMISMTIANPVLGWLADHWSRKWVMIIGAASIFISAGLAWFAPSADWFYLIVFFSGIANTSFWTIAMAMVLSYGNDEERPTYVGMSNTLIAPFTVLAPIIGGWLADAAGYQTTFAVAAIIGVIATVAFYFSIQDKPITQEAFEQPARQH